MKNLENLMLSVVTHYADLRLKEGDICGCENCRFDIIALTLKKLPNHYINAEPVIVKYKIRELTERQHEIIKATLDEAVKRVSSNPQH